MMLGYLLARAGVEVTGVRAHGPRPYGDPRRRGHIRSPHQVTQRWISLVAHETEVTNVTWVTIVLFGAKLVTPS